MSKLKDYIDNANLPCTRLYDSSAGGSVSSAGSSFIWKDLITPETFDLVQSDPNLKPRYVDSAVIVNESRFASTAYGDFLDLTKSYTLLVAGLGEAGDAPFKVLKDSSQPPLLEWKLSTNYEKSFSLEDTQIFTAYSPIEEKVVSSLSQDIFYGFDLDSGTREPDRGKPTSSYLQSLQVGKDTFSFYFIAVFQPALSAAELQGLIEVVNELIEEIEELRNKVDLDFILGSIQTLQHSIDVVYRYKVLKFITQDFSMAGYMDADIQILFNLIWAQITLENWDNMSNELWDTIR